MTSSNVHIVTYYCCSKYYSIMDADNKQRNRLLMKPNLVHSRLAIHERYSIKYVKHYQENHLVTMLQ